MLSILPFLLLVLFTKKVNSFTFQLCKQYGSDCGDSNDGELLSATFVNEQYNKFDKDYLKIKLDEGDDAVEMCFDDYDPYLKIQIDKGSLERYNLTLSTKYTECTKETIWPSITACYGRIIVKNSDESSKRSNLCIQNLEFDETIEPLDPEKPLHLFVAEQYESYNKFTIQANKIKANELYFSGGEIDLLVGSSRNGESFNLYIEYESLPTLNKKSSVDYGYKTKYSYNQGTILKIRKDYQDTVKYTYTYGRKSIKIENDADDNVINISAHFDNFVSDISACYPDVITIEDGLKSDDIFIYQLSGYNYYTITGNWAYVNRVSYDERKTNDITYEEFNHACKLGGDVNLSSRDFYCNSLSSVNLSLANAETTLHIIGIDGSFYATFKDISVINSDEAILNIETESCDRGQFEIFSNSPYLTVFIKSDLALYKGGLATFVQETSGLTGDSKIEFVKAITVNNDANIKETISNSFNGNEPNTIYYVILKSIDGMVNIDLSNLNLQSNQFVSIAGNVMPTFQSGNLNLLILNDQFTIDITNNNNAKLNIKNIINGKLTLKGNSNTFHFDSTLELYGSLSIDVPDNLESLKFNEVKIYQNSYLYALKNYMYRTIIVDRITVYPNCKGDISYVQVNEYITIEDSARLENDMTKFGDNAKLNFNFNSYSIDNFEEPIMEGYLSKSPSSITINVKNHVQISPNTDYVLFEGEFDEDENIKCEDWLDKISFGNTLFNTKQCKKSPNDDDKFLLIVRYESKENYDSVEVDGNEDKMIGQINDKINKIDPNKESVIEIVTKSDEEVEIDFSKINTKPNQFLKIPDNVKVALPDGELNVQLINNNLKVDISGNGKPKINLRNMKSSSIELLGDNKAGSISIQSNNAQIYDELVFIVPEKKDELHVENAINLYQTGSIKAQKSGDKGGSVSLIVDEVVANPESKCTLSNVVVNKNLNIHQSASLNFDGVKFDSQSSINLNLNNYSPEGFGEPLIHGTFSDNPPKISIKNQNDQSKVTEDKDYVLFHGNFQNGCEKWKEALSLDGSPFNDKVCKAASASKLLENSDLVVRQNKDDSKGKSKLSGGQIAGIVIGVVAAVGIIVGVVVFFVLKKRKQANSESEGQNVGVEV